MKVNFKSRLTLNKNTKLSISNVTRCDKMLQEVTRRNKNCSPFPLQFLNPNNTTFFFDYNQIALTLLNLNLEVYATFSQV